MNGVERFLTPPRVRAELGRLRVRNRELEKQTQELEEQNSQYQKAAADTQDRIIHDIDQVLAVVGVTLKDAMLNYNRGQGPTTSGE